MSRTRFRRTMSLITAMTMVPLTFGQNPASPGSGDIFNATTHNNDCLETYLKTERAINDTMLIKRRQFILQEASCKTDQNCVKNVQQTKIAAENDAGLKIIDARAVLSDCESKPHRPASGKNVNNPRADVFNSNSTPSPDPAAPRRYPRSSSKASDPCTENAKLFERQWEEADDVAAEADKRITAGLRKALNSPDARNPDLKNQSEARLRTYTAQARQDRAREQRQRDCYRAYFSRGCVGRPCRVDDEITGRSADGGGAQVRAELPVNTTKANNSPGDYGRGLAEGMGDCIHGFMDLLVAANMIAQAVLNPAMAPKNSWVDAAKLLGLEPGESIVLKTIWQELNQTKIIGLDVSAYDRGKIDGRRLCAYGAVPGIAKAAKAAPIKAFAKAGETPVNPLRGASLAHAMAGDESALPAFSGKWISTPRGPIKLGAFAGKGSFSTVYEMADNPGRVVKIGNNTGESGGSFKRQAEGANRLREAGVETPAIHYNDPGTTSRPGTLITDNVNKRGPPGSVIKFGSRELQDMRPEHPVRRAMQDAFDKLAAKGYAWADGHAGNVRFQSDASGAFKTIVIDPDFVMTPGEYAASIRGGTMPGAVLGSKLLGSEGFQDYVNLEKGMPVSAVQLSDSLSRVLFNQERAPNGSTVPRR